MQDKNNPQIADLILRWIGEKVSKPTRSLGLTLSIVEEFRRDALEALAHRRPNEVRDSEDRFGLLGRRP
jgi:hypothetical protein